MRAEPAAISTYPLTVYYDASCPLCRAEIECLVAHDHRKRLNAVDCSAPSFSDLHCDEMGVGVPALMYRIHSRDAAGRWLVGVPVFAAAYRAIGIGSVAALFGSRWLAPFWPAVYGWVADHRMLLSRLGLTGAFAWVVGRLAARAERRASRCRDDNCRLE